ncbi:hypothetical protein KRR38_20395 [Novosphingobium sp. G106]|uniref:hypothetical protein n=1 Tax=Novosphingobium sp. G106 TaxID=2849500 RepID=UPI001C2DE599|nr:hypothetical protein [Novosphingobium sp. G106]MBV1689979.1 hypothetical protein [Novosphingobium sp. G106]
MMTILLAAAAASAAPALPTDPDVRCMAAYLVAAGNAKDDPSVSADDKAGIQSIVMYFFGKLDGRRPNADLKSDILKIVGSPTYTQILRPDIERCSAEAEARGKYLQSFGDQTETGAPKP